MVFDIAILIIFLWAAYKGYTNGLILQLSTLAALVLGIVGAIRFSGFLNGFFLEKTSINEEFVPAITFALAFVVIVILVHLIARLLEKLIEAVALGFVNRIFGTVFSILKFALVISGLLVVINKANAVYSVFPEEKTSHSRLYKPLSKFAPAIFPYLRFEKPVEIFEGARQELQV
ncbi:MAG: CvpA family protein [Bacteroidales bacterium]|nr:CvpA family protein [Bacteroidales bacterium]